MEQSDDAQALAEMSDDLLASTVSLAAHNEAMLEMKERLQRSEEQVHVLRAQVTTLEAVSTQLRRRVQQMARLRDTAEAKSGAMVTELTRFMHSTESLRAALQEAHATLVTMYSEG